MGNCYGKEQVTQLKTEITCNKIVDHSANFQEKKNKVSPPFPAIYSFNAAAIVLSYLRYNDDVGIFLKRLSKKAGEYYYSHVNFLKAFLKDFPVMNTTLEFGFPDVEYANQYPSQEQFIQMTRYK